MIFSFEFNWLNGESPMISLHDLFTSATYWLARKCTVTHATHLYNAFCWSFGFPRQKMLHVKWICCLCTWCPLQLYLKKWILAVYHVTSSTSVNVPSPYILWHFLTPFEYFQSQEVCTTVAVLLHYFFLAAFFIMLAEGIELLLYIVFVFHVRRRRETALLILTAWGKFILTSWYYKITKVGFILFNKVMFFYVLTWCFPLCHLMAHLRAHFHGSHESSLLWIRWKLTSMDHMKKLTSVDVKTNVNVTDTILWQSHHDRVMQLNWLYSCGICQVMPLKVWPNHMKAYFHGSHESIFWSWLCWPWSFLIMTFVDLDIFWSWLFFIMFPVIPLIIVGVSLAITQTRGYGGSRSWVARILW